MKALELAQSFRDGMVWGPRGRVRAQSALVTRRSLVVFTEQTVLKMRLPDNIPPFDQSALSVRVALSERERWVGRRISAHAYLDDCVLKVATDRSLILLNEARIDGEPVVATWRQPRERQADVLLANDIVTPGAFEQAMDALAAFHEGAPEPAVRFDRPTLVHERWGRAAARLAELPDTVISAEERTRLADETGAWLVALDKVLSHRVIERRIRECHGDVALEHLFLVDPPVFIDARDGGVDEHLTDTAEDVMQLAMELDLAVGPEFSDAVIGRYAEAAIDQTLDLVAPLFKRLAAVRAASELWQDAGVASRVEGARALVELALAYRRE